MSNTRPEDPRGLIDLNARMPVGESPYGIAYGTPQPGRLQPLAPNIDAYLKPQPAAERMVVARAVPLKREAVIAPIAKIAPAPVAFEPVVNLEPNQEQLLAVASEPPAQSPMSDDSSRYAERESQNQNLEKFRGGDAIVITSGALIVILLVVILVLLLT
jgi:hypothetical protein